jgi:hypothetical protein
MKIGANVYRVFESIDESAEGETGEFEVDRVFEWREAYVELDSLRVKVLR